MNTYPVSFISFGQVPADSSGGEWVPLTSTKDLVFDSEAYSVLKRKLSRINYPIQEHDQGKGFSFTYPVELYPDNRTHFIRIN